MDKIIEAIRQLIESNRELVNNLNKLQPQDYNYYLPIVQKTISDNQKLIYELSH